MNVSYIYRPKYLITFGISFIPLLNLLFIATIGFFFDIYSDLLSSEIIKYQIILILILTIEPIIIGYGVHNIIMGTKQFEIEFNEINFKFFKDLKAEIVVPIKRINRIIIIHGSVLSMWGGCNFKKIKIELKEKEDVQLYIRGKKWISKFLTFIELLKPLCDEKQIQLEIHEENY